ncbi:uncharacterized protein G2W53_021771 [Senna tora]|uniref:Uncharacterized protein n=1 Tax=Senna tora TaxID=362788 RepID=A0A834WI64_9FABA|nr:uncharacterized protein G2W53_021771 [Senna tora]
MSIKKNLSTSKNLSDIAKSIDDSRYTLRKLPNFPLYQIVPSKIDKNPFPKNSDFSSGKKIKEDLKHPLTKSSLTSLLTNLMVDMACSKKSIRAYYLNCHIRVIPPSNKKNPLASSSWLRNGKTFGQ